MVGLYLVVLCSGALVLAFEIVLRMGTSPSEKDEVLLYGTCAGAACGTYS